MGLSEERIYQFAALDLFADRDQKAAEALVQFALAHRFETSINLALLAAEHSNLEHETLWCWEQTADRDMLKESKAILRCLGSLWSDQVQRTVDQSIP